MVELPGMRFWLRLLRVTLNVLPLLALPASPAAALDWIVVPYGVSYPAGAVRAADKLQRALSERRVAVASLHELKDLFVERSRRLRSDAQPSSALADARKRALEHAAYGRREAARRAAQDAMGVAESAPEALRDTDAARYVLDACLAVVRVDLQERDRALAVQDAQRCRRLVPDLAPRESTHSAEVVGVLAEAENQLLRAGAGALNVASAAGDTCSVFVQGRRLGSTPFRYEHAPLGALAVFIECGGATSRVHVVQLDEREQTLTIDPHSDGRTSDRDVIALTYASEQELVENLAGDVQRVGETAGARDVVLVRELPGARVEALRYAMSRRQLVALAQVETAPLLGQDSGPGQRLAEILVTQRREAPLPAAFQPRPVAPSAPPVAPAPQPVAAAQLAAAPLLPPPSDGGPSRRRRVWTWSFGAATVAAGAAALGTGLVVNDKLAAYDKCLDENGANCEAIKRYGNRLATAANVMAGVTGAFAVATLTAFIVEGRKHRRLETALQVAPTGLFLRGSF